MLNRHVEKSIIENFQIKYDSIRRHSVHVSKKPHAHLERALVLRFVMLRCFLHFVQLRNAMNGGPHWSRVARTCGQGRACQRMTHCIKRDFVLSQNSFKIKWNCHFSSKKNFNKNYISSKTTNTTFIENHCHPEIRNHFRNAQTPYTYPNT